MLCTRRSAFSKAATLLLMGSGLATKGDGAARAGTTYAGKVAPRRDGDASESRRPLDDVPAAVERLAASVAVQAEAFENGQLVLKDKFFEHVR